ncbi:MAG: hypothetical protein A2Y39_02905 [Candidatus Delongbacteria bacterium GWF2_40_14]|nr:MAG: hypothetical protein A2Y39_02905 [Candidatus Delongbacteria bacterium GWF2_40_14]
MRSLYLILFYLILISGCSKDKPSADVPSEPDYEIINIFPHDTSYFTQGFEFVGDTLVEGTGSYGYSKLIKYKISDSQNYGEVSLSSDYFGEGITVLNGKIYQLTWQEQICFVYNFSDLEKINELSYAGDGWGLCNDGTNLIMSNGSSTLYYRDPADFSILKTIAVKDSNNISVSQLNELEFAEGKIYANIWQTDYIIAIDPVTGLVSNKFNLADLLTAEEYYESNVLNGIAYKNGSFYVTGKNWPKVFEIKFSDR